MLEFEQRIALTGECSGNINIQNSNLQRSKQRSPVGLLYNPHTSLIVDDPKECIELIDECYAGIFTVENPSSPTLISNSITFVKFAPAILQHHLKVSATIPLLVWMVLLICFSKVSQSFFCTSFHSFLNYALISMSIQNSGKLQVPLPFSKWVTAHHLSITIQSALQTVLPTRGGLVSKKLFRSEAVEDHH